MNLFSKKKKIPESTEFIDGEGKKWVQTSTEDLLSLHELNDILESIDREKEKGEIVLARIDFQRVNKEYYEASVELQQRLKKQSELLKKVIAQSRESIERKNEKLRELIDYIKKLHAFLAYINSKENGEDIEIPASFSIRKGVEEETLVEEYIEPEVVYLNADGEEVAVSAAG